MAPVAADTVVLPGKCTAGIVKNHPFVDGIKRTGFIVGILFLKLKGLQFSAGDADAAQAVLDLASGKMDADGYRSFLRVNIQSR